MRRRLILLPTKLPSINDIDIREGGWSVYEMGVLNVRRGRIYETCGVYYAETAVGGGILVIPKTTCLHSA
jgi:hypothetical protein